MSPIRLRIRLRNGLWEGRLHCREVPHWGLAFARERTHAEALRCADEVLTALRRGWRPAAWDEGGWGLHSLVRGVSA